MRDGICASKLLLKEEARAFDRQLVLATAEDMFWILRRTRLTSAAALLNNLNNNNSGEFAVRIAIFMCYEHDEATFWMFFGHKKVWLDAR